MFRDLANIAQLARNVQEVSSHAAELKQRLASVRSEGYCEGVRVEASGDHKIVRVEITEEFHLSADRAALEQRIAEACNIALSNARKVMAREMSAVAGGLGVPGLGDVLSRFAVED